VDDRFAHAGSRVKEKLEAVLPLALEVSVARHFRSTVLLSSVAAVRAAGHGDAYSAALPREFHDTIFHAIAGVWLPMDVALAHYAALDSLHLTPDEATALGRSTEERTRGTLLGTAVRLAKEAGVTPWTVFPLFQRFWERGFDGGGIAVYKLGPKEVRLDCVKVPCNESPYFRSALRGLIWSMLDLFCTRCWIHERAANRAPQSSSYRAQWA
jgi:hypothetical protein